MEGRLGLPSAVIAVAFLWIAAGASMLALPAIGAPSGSDGPTTPQSTSTGEASVGSDWRGAVDDQRWSDTAPPANPPVSDFDTQAVAEPDEPDPVARPVEVRVPGVEITVDLDPLGLTEEGELEVPEDFDRGGWYEGGPLPGEMGPAVITAHVDSTDGPAPFFRLREVAVGEPVEVVTADGTSLSFTVTRVDEYDKDDFPTLAVYSNTARPELRLITCGGSFDRAVRSYRSNVIVWAELDPDPDLS